MDKLDYEILRELEKNSRMPFRDMGKKFGVSAQTVSDRISKLKSKGILKKFTIQIDQEKIGFPMSFVVEIDVELQKMQYIQKKLEEMGELYLIFVTTGIHDIIALGVARDIHHLYEIIEEKISNIDGVKATTTSIALKTVKDTGKGIV